jgi:hypothetical protein
MIEADHAPTSEPRRLEDLRADELRKWRDIGGTREEFDVFWPMILDRLLKDLRGRVA